MKQYNIRQYIAVLTIIPLLAVTVCLEVFFLYAYFAEMDAHLEDHVKLIASQLAISCEYGVVSNNRPFLRTMTQNVAAGPDIGGVMVLNDATVILAEASNPSAMIKHAYAHNRIAIPGTSSPVISYYGLSLMVAQPIIPQTVALNELESAPAATPIGMVIVEMNLANSRKHKSGILWSFIIVTGILMGAISYFIYRASRRISGPVSEMSGVIRAIGQGQLDARARHCPEVAELETLSHGINRMAKSIQQGKAALEQRVHDATSEMRASKEKAEQANLAKSKFLAAASHDLRQPLHALSLFAAALDERIKYPDVRQLVENINRSVAALEELFNALLDVSRLDAGIVQPRLRHFYLTGLMDRLAAEFTVHALSKGLELEFKEAEVVVYSDPALLETMLRNLLANAIRFTSSGRVQVAWQIDGSQVCIQVRDTGIGISDADRERIFEEFVQLENPERDRTKGLGLGLAIVKRLADLLHCSISLQSVKLQGSTFCLRIPLGDATRISDKPAVALKNLGRDPALRVIVIDDEAAVRKAMAELLEAWGHEVVSVSSISAALREAGQSADAVIADYRLRNEETGIQAIQQLRQALGYDIPALLITGDTSPDLLLEAQASGYAFMHKPVNPAKLRAFLRATRQHKPPSQ